MNSRALAFLLLFGCSVQASAEGGCPTGYYPQNTPGVNACLPIPGAGGNVANGYWADRYASVVWAREKGGAPTYTWSAKAVDQASANAKAMGLCEDGGYLNCRVGAQFANGYFVIVEAKDGSLYVGSEFNASKAKKIAMRQCKDSGGQECKAIEAQNSRSDWIGQ